MKDVDSWASKYKVPYDMVLDDQQVLAGYTPPPADASDLGFPMHLVVRTDTMQIVYAAIGADFDPWKAAIDKVLFPSGGRASGLLAGAACSRTTQCGGRQPECFTEDQTGLVWPDGYCTSHCQSAHNDSTTGENVECAGGRTCVGDRCVQPCSSLPSPRRAKRCVLRREAAATARHAQSSTTARRV
jgi:hypothetical protein